MRLKRYNGYMIISLSLITTIIGFGIALYIYRKQEAKKPLMCPRRAPCETVLSSPEAHTFGISNSILGMAFYAVVLFLLTCLRLLPNFREGGQVDIGGESSIIEILLGLLTLSGFVFSGYLVWVQHTKIKQWCVWCLGSATTATILFVLTLILIF